VGEVNRGDAAQVLVAQAVAFGVEVGHLAEQADPREAGVLGLAAHPRRRAQVFRRLLARYVAHLLDADDTGQVVAARLQVGHCRQRRHAARRARRLVAGCGQAVERRMQRGE
jgi:hypothetical protein